MSTYHRYVRIPMLKVFDLPCLGRIKLKSVCDTVHEQIFCYSNLDWHDTFLSLEVTDYHAVSDRHCRSGVIPLNFVL